MSFNINMDESQQEQSSSISEHSYIISSSEPSLLTLFQQYESMQSKRKSDRKLNAREREKLGKKIAEHKTLLQESLKKGDTIIQTSKERERELIEMKEIIDDKDKQVEKLSQTIKDLEEQILINQQATPKPQRVLELIEHENGGTPNLSIPRHSTPRSKLQKQKITFSEKKADALSLEQLIVNYGQAMEGQTQESKTIAERYYDKILFRTTKLSEDKKKLKAKAEQHEKEIKELKEKSRKTENKKSNKQEKITTLEKTTQTKQEAEEHSSKDKTQEVIEEETPPRFSELSIKKKSIDEMIVIYKSLTRRRRTGDCEEAKKYLDSIITKAEEMTKELKNQQEESKKLKANENMMKKVMMDKNQKIEEYEQIIKEYEEIIQKYQQQPKLIEELEKTNIELKQLLEKEKKYRREIEEQQKEILVKNKIIEEQIQQQNTDEVVPHTRMILEELKKIREKLDKVEERQPVAEQENTQTSTNELLYSEAAATTKKIVPTVHAKYSKSAILVTRQKNTNMSLNDIRIKLTRETRDKVEFRQIHCELAKNKNTLIIKTFSDETTEKLLDTIEKIESLKDVIDVTLKSADLRKLIILGIPKDMNPDEIINNLRSLYPSEYPINLVRIKQRDKATLYHLIIEAEAYIASHLLKQQKIVIGFNSCRIAPYQPILRCKNCQLFGHVEQNCRQQAVCEFCAGRHGPKYCYFQKRPQEQRCRNCFGTPNEFPHAASSSECPALQYYISQRNNQAQIYKQNST